MTRNLTIDGQPLTQRPDTLVQAPPLYSIIRVSESEYYWLHYNGERSADTFPSRNEASLDARRDAANLNR